MAKETWECSVCGEESEMQFDACWMCGTSRDGVVEHPIVPPNEMEAISDSDTPEHHMFDLLHDIQKRQNSQEQLLTEINSKVGCLYAYMIFGIVVGILATLFAIAN